MVEKCAAWQVLQRIFFEEASVRILVMKRNMYFRKIMRLVLVLLCLLWSFSAWGGALLGSDGARVAVSAEIAGGRPGASPDEALLQTAYAGGERLRYTVSWFGITAGELVMQLRKIAGSNETYAIDVTARSAGVLAVFYPIEDHFLTIVQGRMRLPRRHEMQQREGHRVNNKLTLYDQEKFLVIHRKNDDPPDEYQLEGTMQNEFSSFFFMRALSFSGDGPLIVPTFADKKRHEVMVTLEGKEDQNGLLGKVKTLKVQPHLKFKGQYEKVGDPLIWFTDDPWRVPTKIKAKIVIGSLTADLVEYTGPAGKFPLTDTPKELPR